MVSALEEVVRATASADSYEMRAAYWHGEAMKASANSLREAYSLAYASSFAEAAERLFAIAAMWQKKAGLDPNGNSNGNSNGK